MKTLRRKFLNTDEILSFDDSNDYKIERHFNVKKLNFESNTLNLWFDHSYDRIADSIKVEAIYLDYSKKIENYEAVEFIEKFNISLPKEGILKHNEFSIPIKLKEGTKVLWKIVFSIKPKIKCNLHISLS